MSLWSWLRDVLVDVLFRMGIYGSGDLALEADFVSVFVRTNEGRTVHLRLDKKWTVGQVKDRLAGQLGSSADGIRVILAGQLLADGVVVGDCDLGQSTILHVVVKVDHDNNRSGAREAKEAEGDSEETSSPLNQSLMDLMLSQGERSEMADIPAEERERHRAHFYVYCSRPCGGLRQGKLRVRCADCREGAIVLKRDPQGWDDVLQRGKIVGRCESSKCIENGGMAGDSAEREAEFYFKCAGHPSTGRAEVDESPPLRMFKPNVSSVPCLACLDGADADPVAVFDCEDRHVVCVDCFVAYCLSRLNDRSFVLDANKGYTLGCPAGCDDSLVDEVRHFKLLGEADYERYQRFAAEECVLQAGGVLCPQPGCGMGIMPRQDHVGGGERACDRKVTCTSPTCGYVFCRECLQGYHIGECEAAADRGGLDAAESQPTSLTLSSDPSQSRWTGADPSSLAIRLTTKPCPKCRAPTERSGGCMHMVCTKSACGFNWCWICQTEWTRDCMASHWFG